MSRRSDNVLLEHYRRLGNQANDFRNRNLRSLVASMVTGTPLRIRGGKDQGRGHERVTDLLSFRAPPGGVRGEDP
jgi:hypothetical protein